jgi:hypothetical protein
MVKNLPYFHVWFSPNEGYGHVIEEEKEFPGWFGKVCIPSESLSYNSNSSNTTIAGSCGWNDGFAAAFMA